MSQFHDIVDVMGAVAMDVHQLASEEDPRYRAIASAIESMVLRMHQIHETDPADVQE